MDRKTLRKVQLIQLDIAKEIKRICDKHDIKYWLDSGSLLGAVRHKGFIPWDDDLDIGMLREDYERFIEIAEIELDKKYYLQNWHNTSKFCYSFSKIRKKGTIFVENKAQFLGGEKGIFIDIFPYDKFPINKKDKVFQGIKLTVLKGLILMKCDYIPWKEENRINAKKFLFYMPFSLFAKFFDLNKMIYRYEKILRLGNKNKSEFIFEAGISRYGKWIIPNDCFNSFVKMKFEDDYFMVPSGYDKYLRYVYGDYMKLPPKDKRENMHQIIQLKI